MKFHILRQLKIRDFLPQWDEIDELLISETDNHNIDALLQWLKDFKSMSQSLKKEYPKMSHLRFLIDAIWENYPNLNENLVLDAQVMLNKRFESAIIKIQ